MYARFHSLLKNITSFLVFGVLLTLGRAQGQGMMTVSSTNGYFVHISLTPEEIISPDQCTWGYNFNVKIRYNVYFSGSNIPANGLYTLQGYMACGTLNAGYFPLPLRGGNGSVNTNGNPWNAHADCATATVTSLQCQFIDLEIAGPGIPSQRIAYAPAQVLPVELSDFRLSVQGKSIQIEWSTASEQNSDFFAVERSADGKEWVEIARQTAGGFSVETHHYHVQDAAPLSGISYYRLRQTDRDGTVQWSESHSVTLQTGSALVFPNPASQVLTVTNDDETATFQLYNATGQEVSTQIRPISSGKGQAQYDVQSLPAGVYYYRVGQHGGTLVKK